MGRGLDGLISRFVGRLCSFEGPPGARRLLVRRVRGAGLDNFRWLLRGGNTSSHSEQRS
jgi:hypothetical protein